MLSIHPRLPIILAIVAALAMTSAIAWQAYGFWQSENAGADTVSNPITKANRQPGKQAPDVDLASVAMFGNADQAVATPEEDIENLPETNLKLVLRGVMSASGEFPGSALIEDSKRNTEAYLIGDELPGNATLKAVRPDRIIIQRAGALENLYFPDDEDRSGIAFAANNSSSGDSDYTEQDARPATFSGPQSGQGSDQRREEIRQRLEQLRNRLRGNN